MNLLIIIIDVEDILEVEKPEPYVILTYLSQLYHLFNSDKGKSSKDGEEVSLKEKGKSRQDLCKKCHQPLTGETISFEGLYMYHLNCFECTKCGKKLKDKFSSVNKRPYCEQCGRATWSDTLRKKSMAMMSETNRLQMQQKVNFFQSFFL